MKTSYSHDLTVGLLFIFSQQVHGCRPMIVAFKVVSLDSQRGTLRANGRDQVQAGSMAMVQS